MTSELVAEIDANGKGLTRWEIDFVESVVRRLNRGQELTAKQVRRLEVIYEQRVLGERRRL